MFCVLWPVVKNEGDDFQVLTDSCTDLLHVETLEEISWPRFIRELTWSVASHKPMPRMYIYQFPFMLLGDFCSHLYSRTCVSPWVSSIAFQPEYRRYARTRWNDYSSRWLLSNGGVSSKWKNPLLSSWWIQKRQSLWTWGTHAVPHLLYDWIYWETESNPGLPSRHKTQDRAVDVMQQKKLSHFLLAWKSNNN